MEMTEILDRLLEKSKTTSAFLPRKVAIRAPRTILCGAPKTGKTSLAREFLRDFKQPLYLNLQDPRLQSCLPELTATLSAFYEQKRPDALVVDHYTPGFPLPERGAILLISEKEIEAQGYSKLFLRGLDFEEYLSFEKRPLQPRHLFNAFLKDGSLPEISRAEPTRRSERKQEILRLLSASESELAILQALLAHMGQKITANHLYTTLKKRIQISKDRLYATLTDYQSRGMIHLVEKFEQKNAPKKLFFWDFTLANALSYERNFGALVENMLFLELLSLAPSLAYTDKIDLILPDKGLGFFIMPFATPESLEARLLKVREEREFIDSFIIVTMGLKLEGENLGTPYTALPFWEFALSKG